MDWETLSLSDVDRLVRAIEKAARGNEAAVPGIISQVPDERLAYGHVTIGTFHW